MIKRNKVKINATVSKRVRDSAIELADENFSNFVENAIVYYIGALDKEKEMKLKEAEEQLRAKEVEERDLISIILKLVSNHPELLNEYNELRKKQPSSIESTKKVKFE